MGEHIMHKTVRRVAVAAASLITVAAGVAGPASSASADSTSNSVYRTRPYCKTVNSPFYFKDTRVCVTMGWRHRVGVPGVYLEDAWVTARGSESEDRIYRVAIYLHGGLKYYDERTQANPSDGFAGHWDLERATGARDSGWTFCGRVGEVAQPDEDFCIAGHVGP